MESVPTFEELIRRVSTIRRIVETRGVDDSEDLDVVADELARLESLSDRLACPGAV